MRIFEDDYRMNPGEEFLRHAADCERMAASVRCSEPAHLEADWRSDGVVAHRKRNVRAMSGRYAGETAP
jgi:hypothetical protein